MICATSNLTMVPTAPHSGDNSKSPPSFCFQIGITASVLVLWGTMVLRAIRRCSASFFSLLTHGAHVYICNCLFSSLFYSYFWFLFTPSFVAAVAGGCCWWLFRFVLSDLVGVGKDYAIFNKYPTAILPKSLIFKISFSGDYKEEPELRSPKI